MRSRFTIGFLLLAALLPGSLVAAPFSSSEKEANLPVDVHPPEPRPVRPVNPAPVAPPIEEKTVEVAPAPAIAEKAQETPAPAADDENPQTSNTAVLQGLNKVTGHVSRLEGPINGKLHFGTLEIIPHRCWKSAPEDRPEDAVLLEIREGEDSKQIFLGWMFSSSPGLSGLEHPVYDVNVLACETRTEKPAAADTEDAPKAKKAGTAKRAAGKSRKAPKP